MPVPTPQEMLRDLPAPMNNRVGTQTNYLFLEACHEAIWQEWDQFFRDAVRERAVGTATGTYLDALRDWYLLPLIPGESDQAKRIRIGLKRAKLWGGITYDSMLNLCANLVGIDPASIIVHEGVDADTGEDAPMRVTYSLDSTLLLAAGIAAESIPGLVEVLSKDLSSAAGAGTRVIVRLIGGATYDADDYDAAGSLYAS